MKGFAQMRQWKVRILTFWHNLTVKNVLQSCLIYYAEIFVEAKSFTYLYTDEETDSVVLMDYLYIRPVLPHVVAQHLVAAQHLRSLRKLCLSSMAAVHIVELLAPTKPFHGDAFPSLESLEVDNMQFLEMFGENDETRHSYPSLRVVSIKRCPKLGKVSFGSIPSLKDLTIEECPQAVLKDLVGVSSSIHTLKLEEIKGLTQLDTEVLKHLGAVEDLSIKGCQELEACRFHGNAFPSLKSLEVDDMQSSEIFGDNDETSQSFPSIRAISIKMCPKLGKVSFGLIPSLEDLTIEGCAEVVLRDLVGASSSMRTLKLDAIKGMTQLDNEVLG